MSESRVWWWLWCLVVQGSIVSLRDETKIVAEAYERRNSSFRAAGVLVRRLDGAG